MSPQSSLARGHRRLAPTLRGPSRVAMYPILLQIGPITIHSYGVAVAAAGLAGLWLAGVEARREGFGRGVIDDLALPVAVAGLAGGRRESSISVRAGAMARSCPPCPTISIWHGSFHRGMLAVLAPPPVTARDPDSRARAPPWQSPCSLPSGQSTGRNGMVPVTGTASRPDRARIHLSGAFDGARAMEVGALLRRLHAGTTVVDFSDVEAFGVEVLLGELARLEPLGIRPCCSGVPPCVADSLGEIGVPVSTTLRHPRWAPWPSPRDAAARRDP